MKQVNRGLAALKLSNLFTGHNGLNSDGVRFEERQSGRKL
jgi:hypothetical protein